MKNQFDELAKGLAQSVTRRAALKKFGVGLAGVALAVLGLASRASATVPPGFILCVHQSDCPKGMRCKRMKGQAYGVCA